MMRTTDIDQVLGTHVLIGLDQCVTILQGRRQEFEKGDANILS